MPVNPQPPIRPPIPKLSLKLPHTSHKHDNCFVVDVKFPFHLLTAKPTWPLAANSYHQKKNSRIIVVCSLLSRDGFNSDLVVDGLSQSLLQPRYFSVVCTETWPSRN